MSKNSVEPILGYVSIEQLEEFAGYRGYTPRDAARAWQQVKGDLALMTPPSTERRDGPLTKVSDVSRQELLNGDIVNDTLNDTLNGLHPTITSNFTVFSLYMAARQRFLHDIPLSYRYRQA